MIRLLKHKEEHGKGLHLEGAWHLRRWMKKVLGLEHSRQEEEWLKVYTAWEISRASKALQETLIIIQSNVEAVKGLEWESDRVAFTFKEDHFICWRSWVEGDGANIRKLISNNKEALLKGRNIFETMCSIFSTYIEIEGWSMGPIQWPVLAYTRPWYKKCKVLSLLKMRYQKEDSCWPQGCESILCWHCRVSGFLGHPYPTPTMAATLRISTADGGAQIGTENRSIFTLFSGLPLARK